jgi:hypothetical protein
MKLSHAAIACLAGAGLALFGATRVWSVQVTPRRGLSELRTAATGVDAQPWLIALALIALAGAGAMLATRGAVRRGLGVLIMAVGVGVAVVAVAGRAGTDAGAAGAGATVWPIACVLGGALVVLAGLGAARQGHRWPVMGARYERRPVPRSADRLDDHSGPSPAAGPDAGAGSGGAAEPGDRPVEHGGRADGGLAAGGATEAPVDTRAVWDALDRGDDPTAR